MLAVNELLTVADPYTGSLNVNSRVSDPTKVIVSRTGANLSFSTTEFEVVSESITSGAPVESNIVFDTTSLNVRISHPSASVEYDNVIS